MIQFSRSIFLILLAALLLLLVVQPLVAPMPHGEVVLSFLSSLLEIAAILVLAENRKLRVFAWAFGLPTLVAIWSRHGASAPAQETAMLWSHGLSAIFLACTAILILRFVLTHEVTADSVLGAICAYLLIGIVAAHLCAFVEILQPGSFRTSSDLAAEFADSDVRSALLTYYSFSTLTTTGYGDIVPSGAISRTLAWMEAAAGQLYLAVLVAGVVSMRVNRKLGVAHSSVRPLDNL